MASDDTNKQIGSLTGILNWCVCRHPPGRGVPTD
jgi:hypothetical protein